MSMLHDNPTSSEFYIRSGAICFGWPHNAEYGASQPIEIPSLLSFQPSGTVFATRGLHHNFAAVNGKWRVFKITNTDGSATSAFFCCHESVQNPVAEVRRINRRAGSPYEADSGDNANTQATFENRIIVINRYDWGLHDKRNYDHASQLNIFPIDSHGSACLIVDYASTLEVLESENLVSDDRDLVGLRKNSSDEFAGVRLFLKNHEYEFGRFGLNENRSAVESLLFFSSYTEFHQCRLSGESVKITRTFEQMVIEDGLACDDFEIFTSFKIEVVNSESVQVPVQTKPPNGPLKQFDDGLSIISISEANEYLAKVFNILFQYLGPDATTKIKPPFEQKVIRLLNECLMTFLSTVTDSLSPSKTAEQAEERFLQLVQTEYVSNSPSKLKALIGKYLRIENEPLPCISPEMDAHVKSFVERQIGVTLSPSTLISIQSAMNFVANEVLEALCRAPLFSNRNLVTPGDVRRAIFFDKELLEIFQSCRMFWPPINTTTSATIATSTTTTSSSENNQ